MLKALIENGNHLIAQTCLSKDLIQMQKLKAFFIAIT